MIDQYRKALLDLRGFVDGDVMRTAKSKKQTLQLILSLLDLLLKDNYQMEVFRKYGGDVLYAIPKGAPVVLKVSR